MRPAPIEDDQIIPGTVRKVIGPPDGDLTGNIRPVEACMTRLESGALTYSVRCILEDDDLEKLARGGAVWITFIGLIPPFDIQVEG